MANSYTLAGGEPNFPPSSPSTSRNPFQGGNPLNSATAQGGGQVNGGGGGYVNMSGLMKGEIVWPNLRLVSKP